MVEIDTNQILAYTLPPLCTAAFIYVVRKIREYQWGWIRNKFSLEGKVFIVTGANTGLGYETTKALVQRNAKVIMACRNLDRANEAISKIRRFTANGEMVALQLDLSSFDSIKAFASNIRKDFLNFDCIINNAGLAVKSKMYTNENFEIHFGVNHLGHFLLIDLLQEDIKRNKSRIVVVSSKMHEKGKIYFNNLGKYDPSEIEKRTSNTYYNNSKLANFYFARELCKRGYNCQVLCPGLCYTDFFRDYKPRWYHYLMFSPVMWLMLRSAEQGAQNLILCATEHVNTDDKNPANGYYIRSLKQTKSPHKFDETISEDLWKESLKMCRNIPN